MVATCSLARCFVPRFNLLVQGIKYGFSCKFTGSGWFLVVAKQNKNNQIELFGYRYSGFYFFIYLDRYFVHAPKEYSKYWMFGFKETITDLVKIKDKYDKIVISDIYGQPYIYYLFYAQYSPKEFQKEAILDQPTVDVGTVRKIDNIEFRHIYWPADRYVKNVLYIGSLEELPDKDIIPFNEGKIIQDRNFLNGEPALRMVET